MMVKLKGAYRYVPVLGQLKNVTSTSSRYYVHMTSQRNLDFDVDLQQRLKRSRRKKTFETRITDPNHNVSSHEVSKSDKMSQNVSNQMVSGHYVTHPIFLTYWSYSRL